MKSFKIRLPINDNYDYDLEKDKIINSLEDEIEWLKKKLRDCRNYKDDIRSNNHIKKLKDEIEKT